jgi:hypothetical protein
MGGDPMKKALVMPAVAVAIVCGAAVAHADPASNNDQYDQFMISHGMTDGPSGYTLEYLLQAGYNQCAALKTGSSERDLIGALEVQGDRASSENIVFAAHRYLCPDA